MAEDTARNNLFASLTKRKKHFKRKRKYAQIFEDAGYVDLAKKLRDCEETENKAMCSNCGKSWWVINRCRQRVCPLCSYRVSMQRAAFMEAMTHNMKFPKMLTLTMPVWKEDPRDGIKFLRESFAKLRRHKLFSKVVGGAYQIEVKVKKYGFHIHMHILLDCPFMPYQKVFTAWKGLIGVGCPQIDIRAVDDPKGKAYIVKYAAKSADFDSSPETIVRWYYATKGQRLFATFGQWYNAKIEDLDSEIEIFKPECRCPYCDEEKTVFLARDGPFVFGGKEWAEMLRVLPECHDTWRPIEIVRKALDTNTDQQQIMEEFKDAS